MRNALILLVVVALVIVTAGAVNHSVAFDVDWVAGTWRAVSLFWVAAVVALVVFFAGLAAALLSRAGAARMQRKLEAELDTTYRRVRDLEAATPTASAGSTAGTSPATAPARTVVQTTAAATALAADATSAGPGPARGEATPVAEGVSRGGTAVTVVAAHGSARVTQVLPATPEPAAGDATAADATAVTRAPGASAESGGPTESGALRDDGPCGPTESGALPDDGPGGDSAPQD